MSNDLTTRDTLWNEAVAQHRRKVREQIVDAALELFAEKGYAVTSMSEVAEKAGISRATLYNYFPDLEHVFMAWIEQDNGEFARLVEGLSELDDPIERLRLYTLHQIRVLAGLRYRFGVAALEGSGLFLNAARMMKRHAVKLRALLTEILASGVARGQLRADVDLDIYVELMLRLMSGLRVPLSRGDIGYEDTAEAFMELVLHGLAAR